MSSTWISKSMTLPDKANSHSFTLPLLEWINIPAGRVTLEAGLYERERDLSTDPMPTFEVAPFAIAKYPVTNAQFQAFLDDNGYKEDLWYQGLAQRFTDPQKPQ